eukprot:9344257-Pyramimonas_sp.AAC.2
MPVSGVYLSFPVSPCPSSSTSTSCSSSSSSSTPRSSTSCTSFSCPTLLVGQLAEARHHVSCMQQRARRPLRNRELREA